MFEQLESRNNEAQAATSDNPLRSANQVEAVLAERGARYGDFSDHAKIAQDLQDVMRNSSSRFQQKDGRKARGWDRLTPVQKQALTVIADKIARILSGDPDYDDNWIDLGGYAKLVVDRLPKKSQ